MKHFKYISSLAVLVLLASLISGGCGGSSSSIRQQNTIKGVIKLVPEDMDTNDNGIPDVFEYDSEIMNRINADGAYEVPFMRTIGTNTAKINLEKDSSYSVQYYNPGRTLGISMLDMDITDPDGKPITLVYVSDETSDDILPEVQPISGDDELISSDEIYVEASFAVEPEEAPAMIIYTFNAPSTGTYEFKFYEIDLTESNDITQDENEDENENENAAFAVLIYKNVHEDDNDIFRTIPGYVLGETNFKPKEYEILDIRRILMNFATELNDEGIPVEFCDEFYDWEIYSELINALILSYEIEIESEDINGSVIKTVIRRSANTEGAVIQSRVDNIPFSTFYQFGKGYYAHSGFDALGGNDAFENMPAAPSPANGTALSCTQKLTLSTIENEADNLRDQEMGAMSTFSMARYAAGQEPIVFTNVGFGMMRKNILVRYDVLEDQPRVVDVNNLKLADFALELLRDKGADQFRREFGDYFVGGYTWGMRFESLISVTFGLNSDLSYNQRRIDEVVDLVKDAMRLAANNQDYSSKINQLNSISQETLVGDGGSIKFISNINIETITLNGYHITKESQNASSVLGKLSVKSVADSLKEFVNDTVPKALNSDRSNFSPLKTTMIRFREIPSARQYIDERLPISQIHFDAVRDFTKAMFMASCYHNSIMTIPEDQILRGDVQRNEWNEKLQGLKRELVPNLRSICEQENDVNRYKSRFRSVADDYRKLIERYVFYRILVNEQINQSSGWKAQEDKAITYWSRGFGVENYTISPTVQADYGNKKFYVPHKEEAGLDKPEQDVTHTPGTNWRIVWFQFKITDTKTDFEDKNYPSVGRYHLKIHFDGYFMRRMEYEFWDKIIYMPKDKYPFAGLKD